MSEPPRYSEGQLLTGLASLDAPPRGAEPRPEEPDAAPIPRRRDPKRLLVRWVPPACLTVAAVALSLYKLGAAPMWSDETASVSIAVQHGQALWRAIISDGGSMSAYYVLLHGLFLAGMGQGATSVRLISVIAFALTVPLLYGLVLRCFGAPVAVVSTALVVTNRTVIAKAQEARGYALGLLLVVAAAWLLVTAVDRSSRRRWFAWAITSALACYTVLLSPLFVGAQIVSLAALRKRAGVTRSAVMATGLLLVLLVPLALLALHQGAGQIDWIVPMSAASVRDDLNGLLLPAFSLTLRRMTVLAIALGALSAIHQAIKSAPASAERWQRVLFLLWASLPIAAVLLISFSVSLLVSYYLVASVPAVATLAALGITTAGGLAAAAVARLLRLFGAGEKSLAAPVSGIVRLLIVVALGAVVVLVPLVKSWPAYGIVHEDGPAMTAYVVGLVRPGDAIIFDQPPQRMIFEYYLLADFHHSGRFPDLPTPIWPSAAWTEQLAFATNHRLPTPAEIASLPARFKRIWVVDGGWAPLPKYLAQNHSMLWALKHVYHLAGTKDFLGVRVWLFSRSGSLPPGMRAWPRHG